MDWVTRKATADKRRGIRWNFTTVLEYHDFADHIALLSSTFNDLHEKTGRLAEKAARVGLKLYARKCKTLLTECASRRENIVVHGEKVDDVEELRQRRCNWLSHILRSEGENDCFTALGLAKGLWTRGRPKTT